MKGPYERRKYDLRRVWECPECHHKERTPGVITVVYCKCQKQKHRLEQQAMTLCDDGPRRVQ